MGRKGTTMTARKKEKRGSRAKREGVSWRQRAIQKRQRWTEVKRGKALFLGPTWLLLVIGWYPDDRVDQKCVYSCASSTRYDNHFISGLV